MIVKDPHITFESAAGKSRVNIESTQQGLKFARSVFEIFSNSDAAFSIIVSGVNKISNGWGIEKHEKGFLILCSANAELDGFPFADLWFYRPSKSDRLAFYACIEAEDIYLDAACFLGREQAVSLFADVADGNALQYSVDNWTGVTLKGDT